MITSDITGAPIKDLGSLCAADQGYCGPVGTSGGANQGFGKFVRPQQASTCLNESRQTPYDHGMSRFECVHVHPVPAALLSLLPERTYQTDKRHHTRPKPTIRDCQTATYPDDKKQPTSANSMAIAAILSNSLWTDQNSFRSVLLQAAARSFLPWSFP